MIDWKKCAIYTAAAVAGWTLAGLPHKANAAVSDNLEAKDVIGQYRIADGIVIFKFGKQGGCSKDEFAVGISDVRASRVVFGCAHTWGPNDYFAFEHGDFGAMASTKWQPMGKEV